MCPLDKYTMFIYVKYEKLLTHCEVLYPYYLKYIDKDITTYKSSKGYKTILFVMFVGTFTEEPVDTHREILSTVPRLDDLVHGRFL